jgi:TetR/AcrR family transcriptional regulator, regulator of cefoperazone and chloramphenicol sensitivity
MAARGAPDPELEDTRKRLIKAGEEVFAEAGYYAATVREICARARTNIALVNYHFGDKLGLYTEVLRQTAKAGHVDAIRTALDQKGSPEEILRGVIRARMRGMRNGDLADRQFRIFIHELARPTPAMTEVIDEISMPIYKRMLELIGGIIGLPPTDEKTRLCAYSTMGQVMVYVLARPVLTRLWPGLKMTPEQLDRIADHIADFSLAYLRAYRTAPRGTQGDENAETEPGSVSDPSSEPRGRASAAGKRRQSATPGHRRKRK